MDGVAVVRGRGVWALDSGKAATHQEREVVGQPVK